MPISTTDDLVRRFRSDVDDPLRGPASAPDNDALWSICDVRDYMQEASDRVAHKATPLFKTYSLKVTAGDPEVRLPTGDTLIDIRRAALLAGRRELVEQNIEEPARVRDDYGSSWYRDSLNWEELTGQPRSFIRNYTPGVLRLVPIPLDDDTLRVTASFSPQLADGAPLPFTEDADIYLMLLWMKKRAYEKHDADTYDPDRSKAFEAEYERRVVERESEARRIRRAPQSVTFSW